MTIAIKFIVAIVRISATDWLGRTTNWIGPTADAHRCLSQVTGFRDNRTARYTVGLQRLGLRPSDYLSSPSFDWQRVDFTVALTMTVRSCGLEDASRFIVDAIGDSGIHRYIWRERV